MVVALLGWGAADSFAGPEEEAHEIAERGRLLFDRGEHAEALKRYRAAYALFPHPTYLFNQGRAAVQLGECTVALEAYRNYVSSPDKTTDQGIDYARGEISRLEKQCGEAATEGGGDGDKNGGASGTGDTGDTGGGASGHLEAGPDITRPGPPPDPRRPYRIATYVSTAVTAALLGYWLFEANRLGVFGGEGHYAERVELANDSASSPLVGEDICSEPEIDQAEYAGVKEACDAGSSAATRANVALFTAVAGAAATGVFVYLGFIRDPGPAEAGSISVAPVGPGDFGLSASLRF